MGERTDELDPRRDSEYEEQPADTLEHDDDEAEDLDPEVAAEIEHKRDEIEHTRSELSQTVDAIQEKLNPQRLVDEAKKSVREATIGRAEHMVTEVSERVRDTQTSFMDTIRENPVPAALAAIGLGWLWMKRSSRNEYRSDWGRDYERSGGRLYRTQGWGSEYEPQHRSPMKKASSVVGGATSKVGDAASKVGDVAGDAASKVGDAASTAADKVGGAASDLKHTAGEFAETTQERLGEFAGATQERFGDFGSEAQYRARRAQYWYKQTLDENPLVIGAAALAVGAALGLALPETRQEAELMGETRDRLMDKAKEAAKETSERVQQVVKETVKETGEPAREGYNSQTLSTSL